MSSVTRTKVFITHTSTDAWLASQLEARIQACGTDTFLDNSDIQHGDDFEERIRDEANSSSEQLVILTPWAACPGVFKKAERARYQ